MNKKTYNVALFFFNDEYILLCDREPFKIKSFTCPESIYQYLLSSAILCVPDDAEVLTFLSGIDFRFLRLNEGELMQMLGGKHSTHHLTEFSIIFTTNKEVTLFPTLVCQGNSLFLKKMHIQGDFVLFEAD